MSQSTAVPADMNDPEATFRRDVSLVLGEIWELQVADEAMAALCRVIQKGRRQATDKAEPGHLPE